MDQGKRRLIMNAFLNLNLVIGLWIWMFHSRGLNNRINKINKRTLRTVYRDYISTSSELLDRDCSVIILEKNLQLLAMEIYKFKLGLSPPIMKDLFLLRNDSKYDLRVSSELRQPGGRTRSYGTESLRSLIPKLWKIVPYSIKGSKTINEPSMNSNYIYYNVNLRRMITIG